MIRHRLVLSLALLCAVRSFAATHTFVGTASDKLSDPDNWIGGSPAGDPNATIVFASKAVRSSAVNDIDGLTFAEIRFEKVDFALSGAGLSTTTGVIRAGAGESIVACNIAVSTSLALERVNITGAISGSGALSVTDSYATLSGDASNTYSGGTKLSSGTLTLAKTGGAIAIPGNVTSTNGGINVGRQPEQIADGAELIDSSGTGTFMIQAEEKVSVVDGFAISSASAGIWLTVDALPGGAVTSAAIRLNSAVISLRDGVTLRPTSLAWLPAGVTFRGNARVSSEWGAQNIGPVTIEGPRVGLVGSNAPVTLKSGSFSGDAKTLTATAGEVSSVRSAGDIRLTSAVTMSVSLPSRLNGTLELAGADLVHPTLAIREEPYVIIQNDSAQPVIGTFAGLPEGAITALGYTISYRGGDGNDVTLKVPLPTPTPALAMSYEPEPAFIGEPVTLRAVVTGRKGTPTGTVRFFYGNTTVATAVLVDGAASITHTFASTTEPFAPHVSFTYDGDSTYRGDTHDPGVEIRHYYRGPEVTSIEPEEGGLEGSVVDVVLRGHRLNRASSIPVLKSFEVISDQEIRGKLDLTQEVVGDIVRFTLFAENSIPYRQEMSLNVTGRPREPGAMLAFVPEGVEALVTPRSTAVWMSALWDYWMTPDADGDGGVLTEWPFLRKHDIWAVIDQHSGRWDVRGSGLARATVAPWAASHFARNAAGAVTAFYLPVPVGSEFRVLLTRPGVGTWWADMRRAIAVPGGRMVRAESFDQIFGVPHALPEFLPGDVLLALQEMDGSGKIGAFACTLTSELLYAPREIRMVSPAIEVRESDGVARIRVSRTGSTDGSDTVRWQTIAGTATPMVHYLPATDLSLEFAHGVAEQTIEVPLVNDYVDRGGGTFDVVIGSVGGAVAGPGTITRVTIVDDDFEVNLTVNGARVQESDGPQNVGLELVLSSPPAAPVGVSWTATSPFGTTDGSVVFDVGEMRKVVSIRIHGDDSPATGHVRYVVAFGSSEVGVLTATVEIIVDEDDHASAAVTAHDLLVKENEGIARVKLTLASPAVSLTTVRCTPANGTATAPSDYVGGELLVSFASGETQQIVEIPLVDDAAAEGDELFTVLIAAENAAIARAVANVVIVDDEPQTRPDVSISDTVVREGDGGTVAAFEVTLSAPAQRTVTLLYSVTSGNAARVAQAAAEGRIELAPGELTQRILVPISGNDLEEDDQTFTVTISAALNAIVTRATATGTILDDDHPGTRRRAVRH